MTASTPDGDETFTSKYLILAVGGYAGVPVIPDWPGRDRYKGESLHGIDYQSSTQWKGKHGIVVGTANTGHDVAEDMVEAGLASVTMVQRGNTFVFPVEWLHHAQDADYNLDIPTEDGDRLAYTHPYKIRRTMINNAVHGLIDKNSERFDALERAGFNLERKGDILTNLLVRFGGHYIDVGTSKHISEGRIKMKGDSLVSSWTEDGLKFEDGTELKADVVVMCTGYNHDFRPVAEKLVGRENADLMDEFFGLDEEGEIRGAFRQNARESPLRTTDVVRSADKRCLCRSVTVLRWWRHSTGSLVLEVRRPLHPSSHIRRTSAALQGEMICSVNSFRVVVVDISSHMCISNHHLKRPESPNLLSCNPCGEIQPDTCLDPLSQVPCM